CGAAGPTPRLTFSGRDDAIACYDVARGGAEILGSFAGSASGAGAFRLFALATEDSVFDARETAVPAEIVRVGSQRIRGLVARYDGCAAEVERRAWVGLDDGTPVGPLELEVGPSGLAVGSVPAAVEVRAATDCAGDVPVGGRV